MRIARCLSIAAAMACFAGGAGSASAASFTYDDPRCSDFSATPSGGGNYNLTCTFISQPACQLKAVPANPPAGGTVSLVAACSGNPYGWVFKKGVSPGAINTQICNTVSSSCTDTVPAAGTVYYSVYGGNGSGAGPVAVVTVTWQ